MPPRARAPQSTQPASLAAQASRYLSGYVTGRLSSGAVLVARADDILFEQGFGDANVKDRLPNSTRTRFRIGSITKSMTWAAIEHLAAAGKIDWDDPAGPLIGLDSLPQGVTIRRLLTHEAGIPDWSRFPDAAEVAARPPTGRDQPCLTAVVSTVNDLFRWSRSTAAHDFPWDEGTRHGRQVEFIGGFVPGFGARVEHYLDQDVTVIVLTNLNNGAIHEVVADLGALVLGEPYEGPRVRADGDPSPGTVSAFTGSWRCDDGPAFTIERAGPSLAMLWRDQPPRQPLWVQSDSEISYPQDWARRDATGPKS